MSNKKRRLISNVSVGGPWLDTDGMRSLAERNPTTFISRCQGLIDSGDLRLEDIRDLKGLMIALGDVQVEARVNMLGSQRTIQASAFPLLMGGLTVASLNEAFEAVPTIGQELVTEMEDNKKVTTIAGILSEDVGVDRVDEGKDFPLIGAGEEKYQILHKRNGRRLALTAESVEENDVAGFVDRVNALGEIAAESMEEQTLRRVCDIDGSGSSPAEPYVLHYNGAGTQFYTTTANNPTTRTPAGTRLTNTALVDSTDLDAVRLHLAGNLNSRGKRISMPMSRMKLLVPDALLGVALKITSSELEPGVRNEINNWGSSGRWRPAVLSSPKLDDLSTTAWYFGDFAKTFVRKHKLRFEFVTLSGDTETFLRTRIAFQARVAWDHEIGARAAGEHVVQCLSGTTAP